jgi:isoquinoline 1-oxidoreductase beta subunit
MMKLKTSRRTFLKTSAAGIAVLAIGLNSKGAWASSSQGGMLNPFVKITSDGKVIAVIKHFEMGQGTTTGLASLIAEELNMPLDQIEYEFAPADIEKYKNLGFGAQLTGGSSSMRNSYLQYRNAGAAAREVLIQAASQQWKIPANKITLTNGVVTAAGKKTKVSELVATALTIEVPKQPTLKDSKQFSIIGKSNIRRRDSEIKTNGMAQYSIDVHLDNQIVAVIKRAPQFGGLVQSFDAGKASLVKGFIKAELLPNKKGVVVFAQNTWSALQARNAVNIQWDLSKAEHRSSVDLKKELLNAVNTNAEHQVSKNSLSITNQSLQKAKQVVEATFYLPKLAHAPMEPLNCTIEPTRGGGVRLHDGCQGVTSAHHTLAAILKLPLDKVEIKTLFSGGSFGRRVSPENDYHQEAAMAFALTDRTRPVQLIWSREDDIKGDYYRPAFAHKARVGLDSNGKIIGWDHRIAGQSIFKGTPFEKHLVHGGVDHASVEGVSDSLYNIPNLYVGLTDAKPATRVLWWRAVGHTHTAYVMESMMDMAAKAAGKDPVAFRLEHLSQGKDQQRLAGVIKLAALKAGWNKKSEANYAKGFACHKSFQTYVAHVVEVEKKSNGSFQLKKITSAVDCGVAVNPDMVKAQIEGGTLYGIGHVMRNEITLHKGSVTQTNFPNYKPLRISDVGTFETHIVSSQENPTGVGEPGVPPAGPAFANAIAALDKRATELPMEAVGFKFNS